MKISGHISTNILALCAGLVLALTVPATSSCTKDLDTPSFGSAPSKGNVTRQESAETRRTLLLYSAGYHNLSTDLAKDIEELCSGYLPHAERYDDQIFVFSHKTASPYDYNTQTSPYLMKIYSDMNGNCRIDTLITYPLGTISASADTFAKVVEYVDTNYPSKELGVIFSSHASGWLPEGYFSNQTLFSRYVLRPATASGDPLPLVKSLGSVFVGTHRNAIEMDIKDFAAALTTHLDYIIFDACLMGGIEVAYELKDKCDKLVFSQTEVLAEGLDYRNVTKRIFGNETSDIEGIAKDYFNHYNNLPGNYRSATISVVDCRKLEPLAEVCREIFNNHRDGLSKIIPANVQTMNTTRWFYDFRDIIAQLPLTEEETSALDSALEGCLTYKAATEWFITIEIRKHSGLTMYLSRAGNSDLNKYYKGFKWNMATGYVL